MKYFHALLLAVAMIAAPAITVSGQEFGNSTLPEPGVKSALISNPFDANDLARRSPGIAAASEVLRKLEFSESITTRGKTEVGVYAKAAPAVVLVVTDDGIGSGSVISKEGGIITNWHVVEGFKYVGVVFKPESAGKNITESDVLMAKVVRIDQVADLALLQILEKMPRTITPIAFGKIEILNVGDDVHAIGHPGGSTWTYTKGFVSQIRSGYKWTTESGMLHEAAVVQTQTPINPGNSGGPLLDNNGRMIGVNSFISEGEGLNFAVAVGAVVEFLGRSKDRMAKTAPTPNDECEVKRVFEGRNKQDNADLVIYDSDCDGEDDAMLSVPDNRSEPIEFLFYDRNSSKIDGVVFDEDRDKKWDFSLWDTDADGKPDMKGIHPNGDLVPSSYKPYKS